MTVRRRFIAGVTCPGCGRLDTIRRCEDGERVWMDCVRCGLERDPDDPPDESGDTERIRLRQE